MNGMLERLRETVAAMLSEQASAQGQSWDVNPAQVLITTGSQQGLDLVAKVLRGLVSNLLAAAAWRRP